jgi:3-oxoacyl-[acyl-carrier-protein] synthase II
MLYPLQQRPERPHRVVVTGAGVVTALGRGWEANAAALRVGRPAFRPVTLFDVSRQRVKVAAEVDLPEDLPETRLCVREQQRLGRGSRLLLWAAAEAWRQTAWPDGHGVAAVVSTTSAGMGMGEEYYRAAIGRPMGKISQPTRALHYQAPRHARALEAAFGLDGPTWLIANACASGGNAVGHAFELVRSGRYPRVLATGYDALSQMVFCGFDSLQALSPTRCRPFDATRDGLSLGEGSAALAMETLEAAQARRAPILGEVVGYGATTDIHHLTQPHPKGLAALHAMREACAMAQLEPRAIGYVNAHGTGTPLNDSAEAQAISEWAGAAAPALRVSSPKAAMGHLLGAGGAVEAVACLMALQGGWLPPEQGFGSPDVTCRFQVVAEPTEAVVDYALSNSFGFGGANVALIFRRWSA